MTVIFTAVCFSFSPNNAHPPRYTGGGMDCWADLELKVEISDAVEYKIIKEMKAL